MNRKIASELHITSSYARMTFVQRWWQKQISTMHCFMQYYHTCQDASSQYAIDPRKPWLSMSALVLSAQMHCSRELHSQDYLRAKMITLPLLLAFHKGDQQDGCDPHDDISGAGRSFISLLSRNASHKHINT